MDKPQVYLTSYLPYRIHTYVSPEIKFGNASHVIETPYQLILVDTQYSKSASLELKSYIKSINKPLTHIIISHAHPDHYLGLSEFQDVKSVWALPEVIFEIKEDGQKALNQSKEMIGEDSVNHLIIPNYPIISPNFTLDGLTLHFSKAEFVESPNELIIQIPQLNTLIVGDLIYHKYHPYMPKDWAHWIELLNQLPNIYPSTYQILPGHGSPTTFKYLPEFIMYLNGIRQIYLNSYDPDQFKHALIQFAPDYLGRQMIDLYLPKLFS